MAQKILWFSSFVFLMWSFVSQFKLLGSGVFEYPWLSMVGKPLLLFGICTDPLRFLPLTWTSVPKCGKNTQVCYQLVESAEPSQGSVFSLRPLCSVLVSILISTSCVELLFWLELLGTVTCPITWWTPLACEPGPMIKHALSHTEGGRCSSLVSLRAVPPQVHSLVASPHYR